MDPKPEDILTVDLTVDIDPTILLGLEFEKMKFVSEFDVESVLSEDNNKIIHTNNNAKDFENQNSETSDINSESDNEETVPSIELKRNKDINSNEKTLSDFNLNRLFGELDLSDSDNENDDQELSPKLRERGGPEFNRLNRNVNRTNPLESSDRHNRIDTAIDTTQIDARNLRFLSGSSFFESSSASNNLSLGNNNLFQFDSNELFNLTSSEPESSSYPQFHEDSRANSIGSPESGYESTGSPPPISYSNLEVTSQWDDDQNFINFVIENTAVCALTDRVVPEQLVYDTENNNKERRINELVEFLKTASCELVEVASSDTNTDTLPLAQSFEDENNFEIVLPPILKNVELPKLGYKLKDEAKRELRPILSQEKFWATEEKIFKRLIEDKNKKRPIRVIYVIDEKDKQNESRTNLHQAVLNKNIEEIYCLVEIQKKYGLPFSDLNIRDNGKTALDYAIQQHMHPAVIDYLKENLACQNVIV